jgi:hypothetical protein
VEITASDPDRGPTADTAATWLFVLPVLTAGVAKYSAKIEVAGLAILAFAAVVIWRRPVPRRALRRIYWTGAVLTLIVGAYVAFRPWPSAGTARSYDAQAILFVVIYGAVAVFALLFFEERLFERVMWRAATVTLWVGVLSCVASRLTHHLLLVNPANGGLRMQGTLSEPSAWAPLFPLVLILAMRRRSKVYLALTLVGVVLGGSPTCILVLIVTVPLYYALTGTWRGRVPLALAAAVIIPVLISFVHTANPADYLNSSNSAKVALGRLLSGIRNVETDGQVGANSRYATTTVVLNEVRAGGWMLTGAGPAADSTYFAARFPVLAATYRPSALWVSVLFDFGEIGVAILAVLMAAAAWRMRHHPGTAAILLPFFIAALINSAEGSFEYAFTALGIMLFTFGWIPRQARVASEYVVRPIGPARV